MFWNFLAIFMIWRFLNVQLILQAIIDKNNFKFFERLPPFSMISVLGFISYKLNPIILYSVNSMRFLTLYLDHGWAQNLVISFHVLGGDICKNKFKSWSDSYSPKSFVVNPCLCFLIPNRKYIFIIGMEVAEQINILIEQLIHKTSFFCRAHTYTFVR